MADRCPACGMTGVHTYECPAEKASFAVDQATKLGDAIKTFEDRDDPTEDELEELLEAAIAFYGADMFRLIVRKWNDRLWHHEEMARRERVALARAKDGV